MMTKFIHNQPVKNRQDLKPFDISNIAWETDEESTSELGFCIVLRVFKGVLYVMDHVTT